MEIMFSKIRQVTARYNSMKILVGLCLVTLCQAALSQKKPVEEIGKIVTRASVEAPLTFLSADEMRGRDTGSRELDIAAGYIASQFQEMGVKPPRGLAGYFQPVDLQRTEPANAATLVINNHSLKLEDEFAILSGETGEWKGDFVYAGYGSVEEIPADIKGKIVLSIAGSKGITGREPVFISSSEKLDRIRAAGGAGLIEIVPSEAVAWSSVLASFGEHTRVSIRREDHIIPHIWVKEASAFGLNEIQKGTNSRLSIVGREPKKIFSKNVLGVIEGSDAALKDEYLVITAHYDHLGVGTPKDQDSIYNGARDNAVGVVSMMSAARFFSKFRPKRSILLIAFTGEEKGLLGSYWYADHPVIPLQQTIFCFNSDGAGYTDKTIATVIGLTRSTAEGNISKGCASFAIKAEMVSTLDGIIFQGTDNFNFTKHGVPSVCFCPGFRAFDAELLKFYHQPADEVSSLDFDYLLKFFRGFVYANYLIANDPQSPKWTAGDKFESLGRNLYRNK